MTGEGPESERDALSKFACPACGGEAVWNPGRQKLVCPFCGTESPAPPRAAHGPREHDLAGALARLSATTPGWAEAKRQVRCQSCRAISVLDPARQAQNCEFCGSAQLVPYDETAPAFRPESVLPFRIPETDARDRLRAWFGRLWFAPNALKRRALTDTVHGVYLPYWTFDAKVEADWTAEAGHYYTTTETYVENGQTRTRQVRHIRWVPAAGHVSHFFDDDLVCASVGVHPGLMRGIEPFPTGDLQAYDPGYVAGWVVERYQIDLAAAADRARAAMRTKLEAMCGRQVPGDTFRNLSVRADWSGQTYKHILAPVWLLSYDYGRRAFQCAINGVTGKVAGEYPKSFWKIAFVALGILVLFLVVGSMSGR
ncbi:MAG TPA: zinc ribbon domain-containing protein [Casimicrobiaceae bacterium]|mgnify:CR=1 FL=1|nr:zinc ribbon domain-containing protein [Casimicrobiaceae bacterium]